jgi:predicted CXXCH cytochrome family protein
MTLLNAGAWGMMGQVPRQRKRSDEAQSAFERASARVLTLVPAFVLCLVPSALDANNYVDPALCAQCHPKIADTYRKTGMGRSFSRPHSANGVEAVHSGEPFYHAPSDTWYAMIERDGGSFQRRWQIGFDGKETGVEEKRVDFILGSGNHGRTYLHLTERNTLQQLPLGRYAEKGGYQAMNPGYDRPDHPGSTRTVSYECMFCHNAYPAIPKGSEEKGAEPQYAAIPEGIDCQRCHGPGDKHIQAARRAGAPASEIRAAIVNPARLTPQREIEVCLQCHLETTSRPLPGAIQRAGRAPFSYQPGQPLADFRLSFDRAVPSPDTIEVAQAGYRFLLSQCYLKSMGKLRCTTCHDPHDIPRGETAAAKYNGICGSCHQSVVKAAAGPHKTSADCIACHMPKRRTDDAVHIVTTDHRIVRLKPPGDLLREKAETRETPANAYRGLVVPFYPAALPPSPVNALDRALAQIEDGSNLKAGLPQLASLLAQYRPPNAEYYEELADAWRAAGDSVRALRYYDEAVSRAPGSAVRALKLGNMLIETGQFARAETVLRRATALKPDDPLGWGLLGWALWQQHKAQEARASLERSIDIDPDLPDMHNYLGSLLLGTGDIAGAEKQFRTALTLEPGIAEWQANLGRLLASLRQFPEASYRFEQSLRLKPGDIVARVTWARLLFDMGRMDDAEKQAKAAVTSDPGAADAHECLGFLLSAKDDAGGAVRELREAVRLRPGFGLAEYELGVILWQTGDAQGAREHLEIAARSDDAQAKPAALELLGKVNR